MMGIFGFVAQTLLTMGLARETAGRGTLAVYIQVRPAAIVLLFILVHILIRAADRFRFNSRTHLLSRHAVRA